MALRKLSDAELQRAVDANVKHGGTTAAGAALGMDKMTLHNLLRRAKERGIVAKAKPEDGFAPLRSRIAGLEKDLKRANAEQATTRELKAIIGTAAMGLDGLNTPSWVLKQQYINSPGVPTLQLSDFHWGERVYSKQVNGVNEFNLPIARDRLRFCIKTAIMLCKILDRDMRYPGIVVPLGGDMISGDIHDELKTSNELPTMPTVLDLVDNLVPAITTLADAFGHVFLPCVGGNHGRNTMKVYAKNRNHTSFDWLSYQFLARALQHDKRIVFYIPESSDAYYKVYNHKYLLTHGDQFRGGDGMIGALGPIIRGDHKKRSRNAQIGMDYDTMVIGHWHQRIALNRLIVNSCLKGYDEYAAQGNFPFEIPSQNLWITHPTYGITYSMPVYVDEGRKIKATDWVSIPKG